MACRILLVDCDGYLERCAVPVGSRPKTAPAGEAQLEAQQGICQLLVVHRGGTHPKRLLEFGGGEPASIFGALCRMRLVWRTLGMDNEAESRCAGFGWSICLVLIVISEIWYDGGTEVVCAGLERGIVESNPEDLRPVCFLPSPVVPDTARLMVPMN